jgi:hypothetical protein
MPKGSMYANGKGKPPKPPKKPKAIRKGSKG